MKYLFCLLCIPFNLPAQENISNRIDSAMHQHKDFNGVILVAVKDVGTGL